MRHYSCSDYLTDSVGQTLDDGSFGKDRKQFVSINGYNSDLMLLDCGVP